MRKKIILFIFALILSFSFVDSLRATEILSCQYKYNDETLTIKIIDGKLSDAASYVGDGSASQEIVNASKPLGNSKFVGEEYYKTNKTCLKKVFLTRGDGNVKIYLTDDTKSGQKDVKDAIKEADVFVSVKIQEFSLVGSEDQIENKQEYEDSLSQSCMTFNDPTTCKLGYTDPNAEIKFSCLWVKNEFDTDGYCNVDNLVYVSCGDSFDIPYQAPKIMSFFVYLLKIGTPIILIFFSIIPLVKAITKSNEDELKKAQKILIKKLIAAALVFFTVSIVQFVIMKVADSTETGNISKCFDCFLNNNCEDSAYYKTNIGGTYLCKNFSGGDAYSCEGNQ